MAASDASPPLDLSHHLSRVTRARPASKIKDFYKYFQIPGIGQLAGGLPNDHYFPYDTLEAQVALPDRWTPSSDQSSWEPEAPSLSTLASLFQRQNIAKQTGSHINVPHSTPATTDLTRKIDLRSALQYGQARGYPPLHNFIRKFTIEHLHPNIPYTPGADIVLTCGATDGFSKAIQAFTDEWAEGRDPIEEKPGLLCEEFAYMNAIQTARPKGITIVPVAIDSQGMVAEGPGGLRDVLENWDGKRGRRPHMMYTVTVGQNPTSGCLSLARKQEIYDLCRHYDIIIIEDDPYWYLQFPSSFSTPTPSSPTAIASSKKKSSGYPFLDSLLPSYLQIDTEGRVLRLDSFSKTMAPGCRMGWITAQPAFIERIERITETSTQQPSGFVQSLVAELLVGPAVDPPSGKSVRGWGMDGWVRWLEGLRGEYERRMSEMCDVLAKGQTFTTVASSPIHPIGEEGEGDWHILTSKSTTAYTFPRPQGGMFVWLTFDFTTHPLASSVPHADLSKALWVFWTGPKYRVLAAPGTIFAPTEQIEAEKGYKHFRLCFAAVPRGEIGPITGKLVKGVQDFWGIEDEGEIRKLLDPDRVDEGMMGAEGEGEALAVLTGMC